MTTDASADDARPKCDCPPHAVSPSQIDTYRKCPRRWGFRKLALRHEPETSSQKAGKEIHARLEKYALTGELPHLDTDKYAKPVWAVVPHLPKPDVQHVCEKHIRLNLDGDMVIHGYPDLLPSTPSCVPAVYDYKTTSVQQPPFTYALTVDALRQDTQALFYASARPTKTSVDLKWIYIERQPPYRVHVVATSLTRDEIRAGMGRIEALVKEMYTHRKLIEGLDGVNWSSAAIEQYVNGLPANTSHCGAYGGCPHAAVCTAYSPYAFLGEKKMPTNIDELMARMNKGKPQAEANPGAQVTAQPAPLPEPAAINPPVEDLGHDDEEAKLQAQLKAVREQKAAAEKAKAEAQQAAAEAKRAAAQRANAPSKEAVKEGSSADGEFQVTLAATGATWKECVQKILKNAQDALK